MKMSRFLKSILIPFFVCAISVSTTYAQDTTAVSPVTLSLQYFLPVNNVPYLEVTTKRKVGRKFEAVKKVPVSIYFTDAVAGNLLGKVVTDSIGKARIGLPPSFKNTWDSLNEFKFLAQSDSSAGQEMLSADITIKKAMLTVDTTSVEGVRTVVGELKEKSGNSWVAVKDIDMQLSIKRMLGNLSVGDEATYTSDSTGLSSAEFKKDSIPGNEKGDITLVAKVDDNDTYGTLVAEKTVNWGSAIRPPVDFFAQRTLWSTRFRTPIWLLVVVYSIVIGVWGTIIYLAFQLIKIKKLGTEAG
ncbi:MAG: hypothetical protein ABI358_11745 [Ginsengibacter sp.]